MATAILRCDNGQAYAISPFANKYSNLASSGLAHAVNVGERGLNTLRIGDFNASDASGTNGKRAGGEGDL